MQGPGEKPPEAYIHNIIHQQSAIEKRTPHPLPCSTEKLRIYKSQDPL